MAPGAGRRFGEPWAPDVSEYSGQQWCERFAGSCSLDDLTPEFGGRVRAFKAALEAGGATVSVGATFRPPERAYLMHFACLVAGYHDKAGLFHQVAPAGVPTMHGVDIDWTCGGNVATARRRAAQMVAGYSIAYPAALVSRHTQRRAIDMTVTWKATPTIRDAHGAVHAVNRQSDLVSIGKTFGVIKLLSDPPHWSDDGR